MTLHDDLREYLASMAGAMKQLRGDRTPYTGLEDFVLREGIDMHLTATKPKGRKGTPKACFSNAARKVIGNGAFSYAEGFMLSPDLPIAIHHAWCVTPEGTVVDPTLGWREGAAYRGVVFSHDELMQRILKSGYYGVFIDAGIVLSDLVLGLDKEFPYKGKAA